MTDTEPTDEPVGLGEPTTEVTARTGVGPARIVGLLVGAALIVGGAVFALAQTGGDQGQPEDPVVELLAAIADEDVLGAIATLDPGERAVLADPVTRMGDELRRLEILGEGFRLDGVAGVDFDFADLEFRTVSVRDDLARIYVTGGTYTAGYDTDALELGGLLTDLFDRFDVDYRGKRDTDSGEATTEDDFLVVHDGPDGWRLSLGYTAAEHARLDAFAPVPAGGAGLVPIGADSPEAALDGFLQAATRLDVVDLAARLSPNEFGALQDYWEVLVDPADLPPAPADLGVQVVLSDLESHAETDGDRATIFVDGFTVDVSAIDGDDEFTLGLAYHDRCLEITGDTDRLLEAGFGLDGLADGPVCPEDIDPEQAQQTGFDFESLGIDVDIDLSVFETIRRPDLGITAHRVGGSWFVAPISTALDTQVELLAAIDREHVEATVDFVEELVTTFSEAFAPTFEPPIQMAPVDPASIDPATEAAIRELLVGAVDDPSQVDCAYGVLISLLFQFQFDELEAWLAGGPEPVLPVDQLLAVSAENCTT